MRSIKCGGKLSGMDGRRKSWQWFSRNMHSNRAGKTWLKGVFKQHSEKHRSSVEASDIAKLEAPKLEGWQAAKLEVMKSLVDGVMGYQCRGES